MAQTLGAKVAAIVRREARPPRSTAFLNKDGGKGFCHSSDALVELTQQVADLTALVQALPGATPAPAGTEPASTTQAPAGASTPAGKGAAPRAG